MSKRPKIPAPPTDRKRGSLDRYVEGVLAFARHEFQKGRDDESVLEGLRKAGSLSAARWHVREAYLEYLGVTRRHRNQAMAARIAISLMLYTVGMLWVPWPTPTTRLFGPLALALLTASMVDLQFRKRWRRRPRPTPS